ncbi:MAG: PilZ domain-containing protein [Gemmatimonadota bacterium]
MRLPIQSMQAVLVKPLGGEQESWFRSLIVDFVPDKELVIVLPSADDRLTDEDDAEAELGEADGEKGEAAAPTEEPETAAVEIGDVVDDELDDTDLLFGRGTKIEVEISFPDGIRRFASVIRKQDLSFGGSLRIDWPSEGTRIQRRDFVRVEAVFPMTVRFEDPEGATLTKYTGATMDISAGGVRLQLHEPIPDDTQVEIDIDTEPLKSQVLYGRVVRSGEIQYKKRNKKAPTEYWVAIEFAGVDEGLRKEMTQLVFDLQRQAMRRSLS